MQIVAFHWELGSTLHWSQQWKRFKHDSRDTNFALFENKNNEYYLFTNLISEHWFTIAHLYQNALREKLIMQIECGKHMSLR